MYQPAHYVQADRAVIDQLIARHPFATLIAHASSTIEVNHLPLLQVAAQDEAGGATVLQGHVARANGVWKLLEQGLPVLAIFQGEQQYISPSWYAGKAEHGKVVPTWNYVAVHAYGTPEIVDDAGSAYGDQQRLVDEFESGFANPWALQDRDRGYIDGMIRAIVNFRIPIARIEGKFKLSQNRDAADRARVIDALATADDPAARDTAALMRSRE